MAEGFSGRGELSMSAAARQPKPPVRDLRRNRAEQVMEEPGLAGLLAGTGKALDRGFQALARHAASLDTAFRGLMRRLGAGRDEFEALAGFNLQAFSGHLKEEGYEAYSAAVGRQAQTLAQLGVPEEQAIAALGLHLEASLGEILGPRPDKRALALVRLTTALQRATVLGYGAGRTEGWRRLDEQERLKLSRDLHDEIGGDLVVLKLHLEMIARDLERSSVEPAEVKLREALDIVARAIDSVRRLTLDLGPALLEQLGFVPALRLYARQFSNRTGIDVNLQEAAGLPQPIPSTHETALYRVLQGALSNVAKHAQATNVRVTVGGVGNAVLVMVVEDDGGGFDVTRMRHGFGLRAMRERIQSLGGKLHVESRPARGPGRRSGTRIEIDLPVKGGEGP